MNAFLNRVLKELDFLCLSKIDLARNLNVTKSTVYSWFERDTIPAADVALKVADFLKVPLPYLLDGRNESQKKDLTDFEKNLLKEARELTQEDKIELMAYIAMKKSLYRMIKADNGKFAIVKDC